MQLNKSKRSMTCSLPSMDGQKASCGPVPPDRLNQLFVRPLPLWKRGLDVVGAVAGLIIFSPLLLLISVMIKVVSSGPVLFRQQRVGCGGKFFSCFKFRTMVLDADSTLHKKHLERLIDSSKANANPGEPMQKLAKDPRIIKGGEFLRVTGLDELPQLFNVLLGQMSLVGPRPPIPYEVDQYPNWYKARFDVVPGLTGLWQVSGKNRLGFNEMIRLDIQYAKQRSLFLDLKIILMTPYAVYQQVRDLRSRRALLPTTEIQMGGKL